MNYKQLFAKQQYWATALKKLCPEINDGSGIYFWKREIDGEVKMYIGKATHCLQRSVSHCMGYKQRLDISIRKWGFYDEKNNPTGWKLAIIYYPLQELDERESYYIDQYKQMGTVELYNIESGGTTNKTIIGERKQPKTYMEGIAQGKKKQLDVIKVFFEKYLEAIPKNQNKVTLRKFEEFNQLLNNAVDLNKSKAD